MNRYAIVLDARFIFTVDADDEDRAQEIAHEALHPYVTKIPGIVHRSGEVAVRPSRDPDARPVTYVCTHCGESAPKTAWGPGWIRCPFCAKQPPSAAEFQAAQAAQAAQAEPCGCIGGVHDHG